MPSPPRRVLVLLGLLGAALGSDSDQSYADDPILQFRPTFARSLPVQLLVTGAVLTLVGVLLIHLLFTTQYHWPLAPVNYVLQMSSVITLFVSLIATVHVILQTARAESLGWPYGFSYIAVAIPPLSADEKDDNDDWSTAEMAAWLLMNATTSGLIQITHIQFLTLLYPSHLEKRLILFLLGPLALLSAIMQLLPIHSNEHIVAFADIVSNVCNATLSLLFTAALFLWGLLVNRRRAWRTDGGTAAFGAGACVLALLSTTLTFVYIPTKDQYGWLPGLMLAVVLWQSFLGWWWWVGAGMAAGEGVERVWREEKRRRKRQKRRARREERAAAVRGIWHDVANALAAWRRAPAWMREKEATPAPSIDEDRGEDGVSRASGREVHAADGAAAGGGARHHPARRSPDVSPTPRASRPPAPMASGSGTSTAASEEPPASILQALLGIPALRAVARWSAGVRRDHNAAARALAAEQSARMTEVYGPEGERADVDALGPDPGKVGWGLGAFGLRERARRDEGARDAREGVRGLLDGRAAGEGRGREEGGASMWWWGPLRRWRLQDTTAYR